MAIRSSFSVFLLLVLLSATTRTFSAPININIEAAEDIAEALDGVDLKLAERIKMQCEYKVCQSAESIRHVEGLSPKIFQKIKNDLRFNVMHRGMDLDDDC